MLQTIPPLVLGATAHCPRCNAMLRRACPDPLNRVLACTLAAGSLMVVAVQQPFLTIDAAGRYTSTNLFTGPDQLRQDGMGALGIVVLACTVILPLLRQGLLLTVLLGLRTRHPSRHLPTLFAWVERLKPWSMVEVYLLGVFVAYTRLVAIATVEIGPALFALGGVMLTMVAADAALDADALWATLQQRGLAVGGASSQLARPAARGLMRIGCMACDLVVDAPDGSCCPRCGENLHHRKPDSLRRAAALLVAAAIFYIPANVYPVLTLIRFGRGAPSTILGGVQELVDAQMWPLALLVFLASITVPVLKLASLTWLLIATWRGSAWRLRDRARLFRLVDAIGRWSMIDVFMISILVALVHMGFLATVLPGIGAMCFAAVVILTMLSAACFDPRLMWDAARAPVRAAQPIRSRPETA